ncbi:Ankyrin repeat domain containing protein [Balamuthia mandrillaris]
MKRKRLTQSGEEGRSNITDPNTSTYTESRPLKCGRTQSGLLSEQHTGHLENIDETEKVERCLIEEMLPDEVMCHILGMLPRGMSAVAARTCHRWFSCTPLHLRQRLSIRTACSNLTMLAWAQQNGYQLCEESCVAAVGEGCTETLQWTLLQLQGKRRQAEPQLAHDIPSQALCFRLSKCAASNGHLHVLEWLEQHNSFAVWDEKACEKAALNGHLEILRWLRSKGCPWNHGTAVAAAKNGHLEVLQWIQQQLQKQAEYAPDLWVAAAAAGVPEDSDVLQQMKQPAPEEEKWNLNYELLCLFAASDGHVHVMQWLDIEMTNKERSRSGKRDEEEENEEEQTSERMPTIRQYMMVQSAAQNGHVQVLDWLSKKGYIPSWSLVALCREAAANGHIHILEWFLQHHPPSQTKQHPAAGGGSCEQWGREVSAAAAGGGHLEVLKWLTRHSYPFDEVACSMAAAAGHLHVLQWLRDPYKPDGSPGSNVCAWDWRTASSAASHGHLHVLQWALANGCDWDWRAARSAAECGQNEVLAWIHLQGFSCQAQTEARQY